MFTEIITKQSRGIQQEESCLQNKTEHGAFN